MERLIVKGAAYGLTALDDRYRNMVTMAGVITAVISLGFHLFWKFRTANSERARWTKTLIPSLLIPRIRRCSYYIGAAYSYVATNGTDG